MKVNRWYDDLAREGRKLGEVLAIWRGKRQEVDLSSALLLVGLAFDDASRAPKRAYEFLTAAGDLGFALVAEHVRGSFLARVRALKGQKLDDTWVAGQLLKLEQKIEGLALDAVIDHEDALKVEIGRLEDRLRPKENPFKDLRVLAWGNSSTPQVSRGKVWSAKKRERAEADRAYRLQMRGHNSPPQLHRRKATA